MANRTEIDSDDVDAAVDETLDAIDQHIVDTAERYGVSEAVLRDAVDARIRHAADLAGGYLRRGWLDGTDDGLRYAIINCGEREVEITAGVVEDVMPCDSDDESERMLFAEVVHAVFESVCDEVVDTYPLVVPVAEPLRGVYW